MKKVIFPLLLSSTLAITAFADQPFKTIQTKEDIQKIINFLITPVDENKSGISYKGTAGKLDGLILPLSYYTTANYWGNFVCKLPNHNCKVTDVYSQDDYTLLPTDNSPGTDLQTERVNVNSGTDIYDASVWQIALGLAGRANKDNSLFNIANNENKLLKYSYDGNANPKPLKEGVNRAISHDGLFIYNGTKITDPNKAYSYRMVSRNWLSTDPFKGTPFQDKYISTNNLPDDNPDYSIGKISWTDWKPITGENAWAFFIGPLQTDYMKYVQTKGLTYIPFDSVSIQNALEILPAFQSMQAPVGGIYYAVKGSLGNTGSDPVDPYFVSVENNASLLAGLQIFRDILKQELNNEKALSSNQTQQINNALKTLNIMLNGGHTPQGYQTEGLLSFFKKYAWNQSAGEFIQGGVANKPGEATFIPTLNPKAVDVNTWGAAVLGVPLLDKVENGKPVFNGFGTAFQIWQNVKRWGGFYGPDGTVWGVGYSDQDQNGIDHDYKQSILSGEWTAGAINMVRTLIVQYQAIANDKTNQYTDNQKLQAREFVAKLQVDQQSMLEHLMSLRSDRYPTEKAFEGTQEQIRPSNYSSLIELDSNQLAFIYASKRYFIPFGWYANPLPSTASTAWAVMLYYQFNPFSLGGYYK